MNPPAPNFVDFFAGSGLVTQGVKHACVPVWSNDICPKKAAAAANRGRVSGENHLRRQ
jgi:site-specific DNA-cytosine methylase